MVNFPASITNYLILQDGVDKVIAQHPNDRGSDITAIQTLLGAMGSSQAYTESYKNLFIHFRRGCQCIFDDATHLFVNAGEIVLNDGVSNFHFRRNTTQITVDFTMIDTGAKANSTVYYVYAVADSSGTNFSCVLSLSSSAPTGYTFFRLIGICMTNSSGDFDAGSIQNLYDYPIIGEWTNSSTVFGAVGTIAINTIYQAKTDGLIIATAQATGFSAATSSLVSDSSSSPSVVRSELATPAAGTNRTNATLLSLIKKNDYFEFTNFSNVSITNSGPYWLPIGAG